LFGKDKDEDDNDDEDNDGDWDEDEERMVTAAGRMTNAMARSTERYAIDDRPSR
jgi:hypothetical protein